MRRGSHRGARLSGVDDWRHRARVTTPRTSTGSSSFSRPSVSRVSPSLQTGDEWLLIGRSDRNRPHQTRGRSASYHTVHLLPARQEILAHLVFGPRLWK